MTPPVSGPGHSFLIYFPSPGREYIKPRVGRTNLLNVSPFLPTSGLVILSRTVDIFRALKVKNTFYIKNDKIAKKKH